MICEIICVDGFLCMSHLDIVHISSVYVYIICILSEHMHIMHILSALVLHMFFPNRQCQCNLYVISTTLYRSYDVQLSFHTMFTQTHIVNAIYMYAHIHIICYVSFTIPYISYYLQLSFRILSPYTHVIPTSSICHLHCYSWSAWAWTIFYCDRNLLLNGICGRNVELFHFRIM